MMRLPQEIQVWYVLPALRRELAILLAHSTPRKEIAKTLGVSEAAVSQYLSSKRGNNVAFDRQIMGQIAAAAARISRDSSQAMAELIRLSELPGVMQAMCRLHKEQEPSVEKGCDICFRR
ncbi:transcriptional regulator [Candidatus Woesearchaeota archaeon]|nr:transcriptional regulator [Candidatus Woesearchaeota archaeon]